MKKLITICSVLCLMLSLTCASWAFPTGSMVSPPPGAPDWWNSNTGLYAYGWWSTNIGSIGGPVSPPADPYHWASNYLPNTAFTANIGLTDQTLSLELGNQFHQELQKRIYVYITGTTSSSEKPIDADVDTDSGVFAGSQTWIINPTAGLWSFVLSGVITPQPHFVSIDFTVPGMTSVTNIWAGENCATVPVPGAILLGGIGVGLVGWLKKRRTL